MKLQQFLAHHGVAVNPFSDEDAQTDPVFKEHCLGRTHHPSWDKIYGDPHEPATSIVFGEKGAGKTALRLQIVDRLREYNEQHADNRVFIIEYDDFNPFLDHFVERLPQRRRRGRVLSEWKLWDHMDAILSLGVTRLVDMVLRANGNGDVKNPIELADLDKLDRYQTRDLLLLAACYDQSMAETFKGRWHRLRRKLRYRTFRAHLFLLIGIVVTLLVAGAVIWSGDANWLATPWPYVFVALGWLPWLGRVVKWYLEARGVAQQVRVVRHEVNPLRQVLMQFAPDEVANQPLPNRERSDDRYEMLIKLQNILKTLRYSGILVLVDRLDEPHLVNGSPEKMRDLLWPMLDNKFLKHPGIGFKLLVPIELSYFMEREDRDFYQRARLDKQNVIPSLQWTGEALYDVANARLKACAESGKNPNLRDFFDESISDRRLISAFRGLRVPRHLFKFMYRLLVAHCSAHTEDDPAWKIGPETFESTLAVFERDQDAFERGMAAG